MSSYLVHFGTEGMHWGVRRYQNPDGTLTEAGIRRYSKDMGPHKADYSDIKIERIRRDAREADIKDIKRMGKAATTAGKDGKPSQAEKMTKNAKDINSELQNIARTAAPKYKASEKAKSMSEKELRDAINRMELERKYDSLRGKDIETGYDKTMKVLTITGSVIGIGAGIAGIATAYNTISQARVKE